MIEVSTQVADRYRIDARIGGGGMADVFEARDEALERDVAIKLLRGIDDPGAARRFAEEIRLTARLNHPNVVRLFDAGEHEGSPYLVLERVTGGTLAHAMGDGGMDPQRVADIGRQTAAALEHAHAEGIVHRDVKPSNILLTADGTVRLADFGIALTATATRLTVAGSVAGSAGYVSPEQVLGTGAGAASDVYALGLVLLECLTGEPPWSGTTVEVALARITADPPMPPSVPEAWRGLLTAMTTRRPEDRPPMGLVAAALSDLAAGQTTLQFPLPVPAAPPRRRLRVPVVVASAALLMAAGAVLTLNTPLPDDTPPASPISSPTAVAPDGVIAASVVRGAAVAEATPSAEAQAPVRLRRSSAPQPPGSNNNDRNDAPSSATTSTGDAPSATTGAAQPTAPRPAAPAPSKPAPKRETPDRTRTTTRDTDDGTQSGGDTGTKGTGTKDTSSDSDSTSDSTDEVADTTPRGNEKARAAKTRGPDLEGTGPGANASGLLK